ncbi:MAG: hypothetical protein ACMG6E_00805 [Candidatus Roizmanbacteria bacterium]
MKYPTYFCQLSLEKLLTEEDVDVMQVLTTPPQTIGRDISFTVKQSISVGPIIQSISKTSLIITKVELGEDPRMIQDGLKSLFLHITFSDRENTLTDESVERIMKEVIEKLTEKYKASVRK